MLEEYPFSHRIMDDYFDRDLALQLESEFPPYHDPAWYCYNNALEKKKTLNYWHMFPSATYREMQKLCKATIAGCIADYGLHGGGWHIHGDGGNLNPHKDYEVHPKLRMLRKWNLIIYLSSDYKPEYGGHLGFWKDEELVKTIEPKFNRAVLFSTEGSVHGLATPVTCPPGIYRKSLAVYYLAPGDGEGKREKALFYPRPGQDVDDLIQRRLEGKYT